MKVIAKNLENAANTAKSTQVSTATPRSKDSSPTNEPSSRIIETATPVQNAIEVPPISKPAPKQQQSQNKEVLNNNNNSIDDKAAKSSSKITYEKGM